MRKQSSVTANTPISDTGKGLVTQEQTLEEWTKSIAQSVVNDQIEPLKKELTDYKVKMIEVLAIFVALFTFVSVDIQVFKSDISKLSALGFTLIMLGALLVFVIILAKIFDDNTKGSLLNRVFIFSVILISAGIFAVGFEYKGITKNLQANFLTKNETQNLITPLQDTQKQLDVFKNCLKAGGWNKCF